MHKDESLESLPLKYISIVDNYVCDNYFIGYGGHCYRFINIGYSWNRAKYYCANLGGYLVEIQSYEEGVFVEGTVQLF